MFTWHLHDKKFELEPYWYDWSWRSLIELENTTAILITPFSDYDGRMQVPEHYTFHASVRLASVGNSQK